MTKTILMKKAVNNKKISVYDDKGKGRAWRMRSYSVFHQFRQTKFANGDSILSSSQFSLLPQRPQKTALTTSTIQVVKMDSKIIILVP